MKNLSAQVSIHRLKELVGSEPICFVGDQLNQQPIITRRMSILKVDDRGNVWFMSSIMSSRNAKIKRNDEAQLFYLNAPTYEFPNVLGHATIHTERGKFFAMWAPFARAKFKDGEDDADTSLIKIAPQSAYYWDTENNKMISVIQMSASTVADSGLDNGVEGTLKVLQI